MRLTPKAALQIQKTVDEVFNAIVNPDIMSKYFISESTGPLEPGKEVFWKFPEFPDKYPVKGGSIEKNRSVSFIWDDVIVVTINLEEQDDKSTLVKVTEDGKDFSEENLKWALGNTEGWANFLACMKAYLEYGIQLRKGAFEFMRPK